MRLTGANPPLTRGTRKTHARTGEPFFLLLTYFLLTYLHRPRPGATDTAVTQVGRGGPYMSRCPASPIHNTHASEHQALLVSSHPSKRIRAAAKRRGRQRDRGSQKNVHQPWPLASEFQQIMRRAHAFLLRALLLVEGFRPSAPYHALPTHLQLIAPSRWSARANARLALEGTTWRLVLNILHWPGEEMARHLDACRVGGLGSTTRAPTGGVVSRHTVDRARHAPAFAPAHARCDWSVVHSTQ